MAHIYLGAEPLSPRKAALIKSNGKTCSHLVCFFQNTKKMKAAFLRMVLRVLPHRAESCGTLKCHAKFSGLHFSHRIRELICVFSKSDTAWVTQVNIYHNTIDCIALVKKKKKITNLGV